MITVTEIQEQARAAELQKREQADRAARKATNVRGFEDGPGEGVMPGHPEPENFDGGYVETGHASPSPQSDSPRVNPLPNVPHYVLPDMPRAAAVPQAVIAHYTSGSPSDR